MGKKVSIGMYKIIYRNGPAKRRTIFNTSASHSLNYSSNGCVDAQGTICGPIKLTDSLGYTYNMKLRRLDDFLFLSVLGHILTTRFEYNGTILLPSGRVYAGQKINGQSLYYFNPPCEFFSL